MNITRQMIAAAHDVTMRHKIVLGHELLGEIYQAMKSASPAQRKPLTDEELRVIENKINPNMRWRSSDEEGITFYPIEYYELVRTIEAAHGITGEMK